MSNEYAFIVEIRRHRNHAGQLQDWGFVRIGPTGPTLWQKVYPSSHGITENEVMNDFAMALSESLETVRTS